MAKLFTNHDSFHVHKSLGMFVLLNFVYRLALYLWRGYAFCQVDRLECSARETKWDIISLLLHAALSWSSLIMPLPVKRNFSSPMIWREFRWHSIIFATRSVVASLVSIGAFWPVLDTPSHIAANFTLKLSLIMGTCYAADLATALTGSTEKRTTNAMPYPGYITPEEEKRIKLNYSMAQMSATLSCITEDPTLSFLALYAIQGAAFLMTLRRKNLVGTRTCHLVYQILVCAMYLPLVTNVIHFSSTTTADWGPYTLYGGLMLLAGYLRIDKRHSKLVTWGACIGIRTLMMVPHSGFWNVLVWFHEHPAGIFYVAFSQLNEYQRALRHYGPIFASPPNNDGNKKHADIEKPKNKYQLLAQDMSECDLCKYPNRRQRFLLVFLALLVTHFRVQDIAKDVVQSIAPSFLTASA